jgi:hypothetical protein
MVLMLWLLALQATVLCTRRTLAWTGYTAGGTSDTLRLGMPTAVEIHTEQRSDRPTVRTVRWFPASMLLVLISAYAAAMPTGWWLTRSLSPARRRRDEPATFMLIVIAACLIVSVLPPVHHWLRPRFAYPDFAVVPAARLSLVAVPAALVMLSVRASRARRTQEARGFAVEPLPPDRLAG